MGTKVELHQFIDLSVDIHERKSTVNFVYLNRVLHELVNHLGIGNLEVRIEKFETEVIYSTAASVLKITLKNFP